MSKNFSKSVKAIVNAQIDPTLFDSNCYHKPKINQVSAQLAEQGRQRLQQRYKEANIESMFTYNNNNNNADFSVDVSAEELPKNQDLIQVSEEVTKIVDRLCKDEEEQ